MQTVEYLFMQFVCTYWLTLRMLRLLPKHKYTKDFEKYLNTVMLVLIRHLQHKG